MIFSFNALVKLKIKPILDSCVYIYIHISVYVFISLFLFL